MHLMYQQQQQQQPFITPPSIAHSQSKHRSFVPRATSTK